MIANETNHYKVVRDTLDGVRAVDEQTFTSVGSLSDRLSQLKAENSAFAGIEFSDDIQALTSQEMALAVS